MKTKRRILTSLALVALAAVATGWYVSRVTASSPATSPSGTQDAASTLEQIHLAMIGIGRGQAARINAVNIADPNDHDGGEPIEVLLKFEDSEGNIVARKIETLMPGHAASLEITSEPLLKSARTLEIVPSIGARIGPCNKVLGTVEVYDSSTGRTNFAIGSEVRFVVAPVGIGR